MSDELIFSLPRLTITLDAFAKLQAYIRESYVPRGGQKFLMEVSGFGQLKLIDPGHLEIVDVFVIPQVCSRGHTSLLGEAVGDFLMTIAEDDSKDPREYALWWHSHCTSHAYFSPTDQSTINSLSTATYWVSMVGNVQGHLFAQIDVFRPERRSLSIPRLRPDATAEEVEACIAKYLPEIQSDIAQHVSFITYEEGEEEKLRHLTRLYGEERARRILYDRERPND